MPTNLVEWTIRMVMLVLAGLVTLSILGSIAAISNDRGGVLLERSSDRMEPDTRTSTETAPPEPEQPANSVGVQASASDSAVSSSGPPGSVEGQAAAPHEEPDRWLEAIAHALLALAGLAALATLLLWRGVRQLRRIADRLELAARNE